MSWEDIGLYPADILLPNEKISLPHWAVVACDQYTSEGQYWDEVKTIVGDRPSTFHMVLPEAWLYNSEKILPNISGVMRYYTEKGILEKSVDQGFILIERTVSAGKRLGLIAAIDLEEYSFDKPQTAKVRPSEKVVYERITPRLKVRENASLELPHVIILVDDIKKTLIEPIYKNRKNLDLCYDFPLMQLGGHIRGWKIDKYKDKESIKKALQSILNQQKISSNSARFIVGDGNHSLVAAKAYWDQLKTSLSDEEKKHHKARFALVEIQNIYDPAIEFKPIHRLIKQTDQKRWLENFTNYCEKHHVKLIEQSSKDTDENTITIIYKDEMIKYKLIYKDNDEIIVNVLQNFLDDWSNDNPKSDIDYIHGDASLTMLANIEGNLGILLPSIDKQAIFPFLEKNNVFPQKSFSIGEANEKRFYLESRKIK